MTIEFHDHFLAVNLNSVTAKEKRNKKREAMGQNHIWINPQVVSMFKA